VSFVARIDDEKIRRIIVDAVGPHASLAEAQRAGMYVVRQRDAATELAMPLAPRAAEHLVSLPWASRCEEGDVIQAALLGLVEAVGTYDVTKRYNGKPIAPSTHFYWRIRKRVYEEIQDTHWVVARPSRSDVEAYMKGSMSECERRAYTNAVLRPVDNPDEKRIHQSGESGYREFQGWRDAEGMR
jgi:hypothetical protein